jgi:hypothetical protein
MGGRLLELRQAVHETAIPFQAGNRLVEVLSPHWLPRQ